MFRSLALFIGLRYVRAKRRDRFVSLTTLISILCVTLGVFILILVLSVMNGFANEIRNRLLSMEAHVLLKDVGADWQTAIRDAKKHPEVIGAAPILQQTGLISVGSTNKGVAIRGIDAKLESEISDIGSKMVYGSLEDLDKTPYGIVLGYEVAKMLFGPDYIKDLVDQANTPTPLDKNSTQRAGPGKPMHFDEKILLTVPIFQVTVAGTQARSRRFQVVGIFKINFNQYDTDMVLVNLRDAQRLFNLENGVSTVQLRLKDMGKAIQVKADLVKSKVAPFIVDWSELHPNVFSAIRMEKRMMLFILSMLVVVSSLIIVSSLVMVVTEKQSDIAILITMGAAPSTIRFIFIIQGLVIGVVGTLLGASLGVLTAYNVENIISFFERVFGFEALSSDIYYINKIVGEVDWMEVALICGGAFIITLLATLYPADRAARTQPAQALRYE